jgi:PAS domain S-box-containing protein
MELMNGENTGLFYPADTNKDVFDNLPCGFIILNPVPENQNKTTDYLISYVNKAGSKYFNILGEISGRKLSELFPDDFELIISKCIAVSKTGISENIKLRDKNSGRNFEAGLSKLNSAVTLSWNTHASEQDENLNKADELFNKTFHASPDAFIISRVADGKIIEVNRSTEILFQYSKEELLGKTSLELGLFYDSSERKRAVDILQSTGSLRDFPVLVVRRSGEIRKVSLSVEIIILEGDNCMITSARDLTERENMEGALRAGEERYRSTLDNMKEGCAIIGFDWRYLYVNEANAKHAHLKREEMVGQNILDIIPGVENSVFFSLYKRCMEERIPGQTEASFTFEDGSTGWYESIVQPVPEGIFIISMEISERKLAEEALRKSEEQYHTLFNSIDEGFCIIQMIFDENGKPFDYLFLEVNPALEKQSGLINAKDKKISELAPGHEEYWFDIYGHVSLTGKPARFQNRAEQLHRWFDVYAFSIGRLEDRKVAVLFNDITERKNFEEALRINESKLLDAQKLARFGNYTIDIKNNNKMEWSDQMYELWEVDRNKPIPPVEELWDLIHPDDRERLKKIFSQVGTDGKIETEFRILFPDNRIKYVYLITRAYFDEEGNVIRRQGVEMDITEKKVSHLKLQEAYVQIEERLREKEVLLREIHHRTKNNMQVISSLIGLKAAAFLEPDIKSGFEEMRDRIRAIALVYDQLYQSPNLSSVNLKGYIRELLQLLMRSYFNKNIELKYKLEEVEVLIDIALPCGLIITELFLNSLKHAFPGDREGWIEIKLRRIEEHTIELVFSDNGIGLEKSDADIEGKIGLQLFRSIAESQLDAKIELKNEKGVTWKIHFKDNLYN